MTYGDTSASVSAIKPPVSYEMTGDGRAFHGRVLWRLSHETRSSAFLPYTSKYNPIEHRLFPHVARACQGIILETVAQVQSYMAKTKTRTGLSVAVNIMNKAYETGRKVVEGFKKTMRILFDNLLPRFNYRAIPTAG